MKVHNWNRLSASILLVRVTSSSVNNFRYHLVPYMNVWFRNGWDATHSSAPSLIFCTGVRCLEKLSQVYMFYIFSMRITACQNLECIFF